MISLILVADLDKWSRTVKWVLLARPESLEMAPVKFEVQRHFRRDSGCRTGAVEYLRKLQRSYRYALVLFDLDGSGSDRSREETQREVEEGLIRSGWNDGAVGDGPASRPLSSSRSWKRGFGVPRTKIPEVLGWRKEYAELRRWLCGSGTLAGGESQASEPEESDGTDHAGWIAFANVIAEVLRTCERSQPEALPRPFVQ